MELKKKKIIVSGCAKGMGEATLNSYVKAGAHVIDMDVDSEIGQTVAANRNKNDEGTASFCQSTSVILRAFLMASRQHQNCCGARCVGSPRCDK